MNRYATKENFDMLKEAFGLGMKMQKMNESDLKVVTVSSENAFEGMTNGDVIKAMFPNSEPLFMLRNVPKEDIIKIDNEVFMVDRNWWNAPYKREVEE